MSADFFGDYVVSKWQQDNVTYSDPEHISSFHPWAPDAVGLDLSRDDPTSYPVKERIFNYLKGTGYVDEAKKSFLKIDGAQLSHGIDFYSTASAADVQDNSLMEWVGIVASLVTFGAAAGVGSLGAAAAAESTLGAIPAATTAAEEAAMLGIADVSAASGEAILAGSPLAEEIAMLGGGITDAGTLIAEPLVATPGFVLPSALNAASAVAGVASAVAAGGGGGAAAGGAAAGAAAGAATGSTVLNAARIAAAVGATAAGLATAGNALAAAKAKAADPMAAFASPAVLGSTGLPIARANPLAATPGQVFDPVTGLPIAGAAAGSASTLPAFVISGIALAAIYLVFVKTGKSKGKNHAA